MSDSFPSIAFQSSLSTSATLIAVFSFLYSIFIIYSTPGPDKRGRPPIVRMIRLLCRIIAGLSFFNFFLTVASVLLLGLRTTTDVALAVGLIVTVGIASGISLYLAVKAMP